jgi:hypothetical protein
MSGYQPWYKRFVLLTAFPPVLVAWRRSLGSQYMASWREIDRVRKDPQRAADIAKRLLSLPASELSDWELDFLRSIRRLGNVEEFTTRQAEKLLQIRDDIQEVTEVLSFSVELLLKRCFEARLDLSEADEEWVVGRFQTSPRKIRRKHVGRLMRCARELNLVEEEYPEKRVRERAASRVGRAQPRLLACATRS